MGRLWLLDAMPVPIQLIGMLIILEGRSGSRKRFCNSRHRAAREVLRLPPMGMGIHTSHARALANGVHERDSWNAANVVRYL
jgi:hypothetical protein